MHWISGYGWGHEWIGSWDVWLEGGANHEWFAPHWAKQCVHFVCPALIEWSRVNTNAKLRVQQSINFYKLSINNAILKNNNFILANMFSISLFSTPCHSFLISPPSILVRSLSVIYKNLYERLIVWLAGQNSQTTPSRHTKRH